jgi:selenium metabolism protein YedF|uniref:Sulfurtransferase-like selenium metabolism protein YedF n=1 Tax=Desulfobacca acetoxidans TaxID=60893 RepID=A0A7V6DPI2_9BACT
MQNRELDCRGQACPQPVLKTKEIIDQGDVLQLTVLVDNDAARENVSRFLERSGYQVQVAAQGSDLAVTGIRKQESPGQAAADTREETELRKILVLVGTDRLGTGDDELGKKLIVNFINTLKEMGRELWALVLLNAGVRLAVAGSEVLASLQELEDNGVMVLVCGTCLNHFQLLEQKQVGETTNMLDIVTHMQLADQVISFT